MVKDRYEQFYNNAERSLKQTDVTASYIVIREMQQFLHKTNDENGKLLFKNDMKYFYTLCPTINFLNLSEVDGINYIRLLIIFEDYVKLSDEHEEQLMMHSIIQAFSTINIPLKPYNKLHIVKAMVAFLTKGNLNLPEGFCEQLKSYMVMEKITE